MFGRKKGEKGQAKSFKKQVTGKYGKTKLRHSRMGQISCSLSLIALLLILGALGIAYLMRENTISAVGGIGFLSIVVAVLGFRAALKGFRDRDCNYITCRWGIAFNSVVLLGLLIIFIRGVV